MHPAAELGHEQLAKLRSTAGLIERPAVARNLLKLYAERRVGVVGSKFRTRAVMGALLLSFAPTLFLSYFAYGLMNRSIDKWFSRPIEEVREDTAAMSSMIEANAQQKALSE